MEVKNKQSWVDFLFWFATGLVVLASVVYVGINISSNPYESAKVESYDENSRIQPVIIFGREDKNLEDWESSVQKHLELVTDNKYTEVQDGDDLPAIVGFSSYRERGVGFRSLFYGTGNDNSYEKEGFFLESFLYGKQLTLILYDTERNEFTSEDVTEYVYTSNKYKIESKADKLVQVVPTFKPSIVFSSTLKVERGSGENVRVTVSECFRIENIESFENKDKPRLVESLDK